MACTRGLYTRLCTRGLYTRLVHAACTRGLYTTTCIPRLYTRLCTRDLSAHTTLYQGSVAAAWVIYTMMFGYPIPTDDSAQFNQTASQIYLHTRSRPMTARNLITMTTSQDDKVSG